MATGRRLLSACMPSRYKQTLLCPVRTLFDIKKYGNSKAKNAGHTHKEGQTKVRRLLKRLSDSEIAEAVKDFEDPTIGINSKDEMSQIIDCNSGRLIDSMEKWL